MKKITLLLLALFIKQTHVFANCGGNGIFVYPNEVYLPTNAMIMIEGYAHSAKIINEINGKYQAWLFNKYSRIKLKVIQNYSGQVSLTQTLLRPEKTPDPSIAYVLVIDSLPPEESLNRYVNVPGEGDSIRFRFSKPADTVKPVLFSSPILIRKYDSPHFCTSSNYVKFSCPVIESSSFLVIATVKDKTTGKVITACITPNENSVSIGFMGCSGSIDFEDNHQYEVSFVYLDISGNRCIGPAPISFTPAPHKPRL